MLVGAREALGVAALAPGVVIRQVDEVDRDHPGRQLQRGLHRIGEPSPDGRLGGQPVDHHVDRVLLLLVEHGRAGERMHLPVDADAGEALAEQLGEQIVILALAAAHDRGQDLEAGALLQPQQPVHDLLRRLAADRLAALGAVRPARPREQQPQVVVDLRDRPDRGARVAVGGLLVDRHRGRQALDEVDVRLVHLTQELPGVRRQRLDVAPLPLGEDGVEGQRGLPGARQAGEHDQRIARQVQVHVPEVVFPGASDEQSFSHDGHRRRPVGQSPGPPVPGRARRGTRDALSLVACAT